MRLEIEIEDGIPPPKRHAPRTNRSPLNRALGLLRVGQSFVYEAEHHNEVRNVCVAASGTWPGRAFVCRKVGPGRYRIWRDA